MKSKKRDQDQNHLIKIDQSEETQENDQDRHLDHHHL